MQKQFQEQIPGKSSNDYIAGNGSFFNRFHQKNIFNTSAHSKFGLLLLRLSIKLPLGNVLGCPRKKSIVFSEQLQIMITQLFVTSPKNYKVLQQLLSVLSCVLLFQRTQVKYFSNSVLEIYTTQRDYKPVPSCVHHCQMSI